MVRNLLDNPADIRLFRTRLLDWYRDNKRDLVWRDSDNPYHIWIAEIMLQQTRVEQMGGYFERFIQTFPTVRDLAAASEDQVLKVWEGLGYYARARNLHKAAKQLVEMRGGRLPDTRAELEQLPGVGSYTAAAVSSIAFERDHPVLDGNVARVLCRVLRLEEDPRKAHTKTHLISAGEQLLAPGQAGDFNQAMMELGARVCTPMQPQCAGCPLRTLCRAYAELEDPTALPVKAAKKKRPHYQVAAGLIWSKGKLLIAQRPSEGLLGGLWEFPGGKQESGESLEECLVREIREELGIAIAVEEYLTCVDHGYSHFSITLHAFKAQYVSGTPQAIECAAWRWVAPEQLATYVFPRADRRIIEYLGQNALQLELFELREKGRKKE